MVNYLIVFIYLYSGEEKNNTENRVILDDVNQINRLSYKVLNTCNIWKSKNKNNNTMLKSGDGKLMMTNGISISVFAKKHNL